MNRDKLEINRATWNKVSDLFIDASALPYWGPFGIGDDLDLIPEIAGKTFLEIGCGSGRSVHYLVEHGAKKVYGLDLSDEQIKEAGSHNASAVSEGKIELIRSPMEEKILIEPVDVVFSVYGLGWTQDPQTSLANIHSYLKPGGRFVWSWDHSFFTDVGYENGKYIVQHSYHDEQPTEIVNWKREGCRACITYRKTDSWFRLLIEAGFQITNYYEPKPKSLHRAHVEPERYYSIQKAEKVPASFIFVCRK